MGCFGEGQKKSLNSYIIELRLYRIKGKLLPTSLPYGRDSDQLGH